MNKYQQEIIRDAANDLLITIDRAVGAPIDAYGGFMLPDAESYAQAMRVARAEADAVWDEELDPYERKIASLLAVTFWMQRIAANMAGDQNLEVYFTETGERMI